MTTGLVIFLSILTSAIANFLLALCKTASRPAPPRKYDDSAFEPPDPFLDNAIQRQGMEIETALARKEGKL